MLPLYTDDDYLLPPPYSLADMDVLGFWLNGKAGKMQAFLDKYMNVDPAVRYALLTDLVPHPLAPLVADLDYPLLLTFHNIGRLFSSAVMDGQSLEDRGFFTYKEMILWMPVFAINPQLGALLDFADGSIPPVFLVTPLILADNALAVAGGREIFGLPKRMATIYMPTIPSQQALALAQTTLDQVLVGQGATAITDVIATYSRTTRATRQSIIDVTFRARAESGTVAANTWVDLLEDVAGEAAHLLGELGLLPALANAVKAFIQNFAQGIDVVAHKQLRRGAGDYRQTSFSAMNTMKYKLTLQEGHLIRGMDIDITPHAFASISLTEMLGLNPQQVGYAFHARMNGELGGDAEKRLNP